MTSVESNHPHPPNRRPALSALDRLNLLYIALIILLIVVCRRRIDPWPVCLATYLGLGIVLLAFLTTTARSFHPVIGFIRDWYTPFLFLLHYEFTYLLNQSFAPLYAPWLSRLAPTVALTAEHIGGRVYFDRFFALFDQQLFGFQPSLHFAQVFGAAWFGEIMHLAYFSYYVYVPLLCGILWFRPKREPFDDSMFRATLTMWFSILVFIILPVAGPRQFFGPEGYNLNRGYLFAGIMKFLFDHGEIPNGAFPSSHVAVALVVLILASRYQKRLFFTLIVPFLALCLSTVYVAEHYVVDVVAGLLVGALFYMAGAPIRRLLRMGGDTG